MRDKLEKDLVKLREDELELNDERTFLIQVLPNRVLVECRVQWRASENA